ncbi:MAG: low-specificity L-threonine aldolase [Bacteroidetes bacterium]|nr:MAG: low-specificity L-threonine aldolase [Bacteroidota bacterium]
MHRIDLRSDTVTKPSKGMLDAIYNAPVGDDVFHEDPTVNKLEDYVAEMFGMEAAIFCSSGTQTNQIAINVHVRPGDEVITHVDSHVYKYEGGGIARNSGASVRLLDGNRGRLRVEDIANWINNPEDVHLPLTRLVSLEDTANRGGGAIYDFEEIKRISTFCKANGLPLHLDGARLMNAMIENNVPLKEYANQFDSISLCLSKGLGAPVGSVLIGKKDFIKKARRVRKVFGGGMRQAGFIAAGGLYALENNVKRLKEDHKHAKALEQSLNELSWVKEVIPVQTNIVVFVLNDHDRRDNIIAQLAEKGVYVMAFGPGMIRMVTHLDVTSADIDQTIHILRSLS